MTPLVSCWCLLIIGVTICAEDAPTRCPNPDEYPLDFAERAGDSSHISLPPSYIDSLHIQAVDSFSASIQWNIYQNLTDSSNNVIPICHFRVRFSYKSPQRGQLQRNFHLDIKGNQSVADIPEELTPNTSVRLQVFTCYYYDLNPSEVQPPHYICSQPNNLTFRTLPATSCSQGQYSLNGTCMPCACNGKSDICITDKGYCVDCLDNSNGAQCEGCLNDYKLNNDTSRCERMKKPAELTTGLPLIDTRSASIRAGETTTPSATSITRLNTQTPEETTTQSISSTPGNSTSWNTSHPPHINPLVTASATDSPHKIYQSLSVITAICSVIGGVVILLLIIIIYRRVKLRGKTPVHFWTIRLQGEDEPSVAFRDIPEATFNREDNFLIENDLTAHSNQDKLSSFASDENPYRQLTT